MDKKKIARLFVDSFKTDIKEVILEGELKGCGGTVESRKRYEVIFGNYATYQKREFSRDYRNFAKTLAAELGLDYGEIKVPYDSGDKFKNFYYQWDAEQRIVIPGITFKMCRKMMNMPHAVLDGCSHTFYIDIDDRELAEEISALHEKAVADKERARKDAFPGRVEKAKTECGDMIDVLTKIINGGLDIDDEDMSRIHDAHFQVCKMLSCSL